MQPEAAPADPMAGDASEIENENSFPHFLTETEALAAEDPMAAPEETAVLPETEETAPVAEEAPAASENGEDVLAEAQIKDTHCRHMPLDSTFKSWPKPRSRISTAPFC